jgi:low affinity Fe/Cu permease
MSNELNKPNEQKRGGTGFSRFAQALSQWAGRPLTFALACVMLVGWALSGPFFHFNDTWQLVINTSTTIITFLMVFLIQSTQNRDTDALHIKIDELLRTTHHAHRVLMGLDDMGSEELQKLRKTYEEMGEDNAEEGSPQKVADREEETEERQQQTDD